MENNWTINQTKELFALVKEHSARSSGLKSAFTAMAEKSGKSVNSVRNYYYSQLKMFQLVPKLAEDLGIETVNNRRAEFETFSPEEIEQLMVNILTQKAKGESVRGAIAKMAKDPKEALRLQNKYRSMVAHHKGKVTEIMNGLSEKNIPYFNPYLKRVVDGQPVDNVKKLNEYVSKMDATDVAGFLNLLSKFMS